MRKFFSLIAGVLFILIGVIGLVMPILPGWVFIFVGLSFIAPRVAARLKRRFFLKLFKKNIVYLESWHYLGVKAGFTTRHFPFSLKKTGELLDPLNQKKLRELFLQDSVAREHKIPAFLKCVFLDQVHGARVAVLDDIAHFSEDKFYHLSATDGVITNIRDLTLLVMTADCLSVFFYAPATGASAGRPGWVGLVHAGWRGTKEGITADALKLLLERSGAKPSDVRVIFGPRIGGSHYEVGKEFQEYFPQSSLSAKDGKIYFDLSAENQRQLVKAGIPEKNILDLDVCTIEENDNFYSFRREKETAGRTLSFITKV